MLREHTFMLLLTSLYLYNLPFFYQQTIAWPLTDDGTSLRLYVTAFVIIHSFSFWSYDYTTTSTILPTTF